MNSLTLLLLKSFRPLFQVPGALGTVSVYSLGLGSATLNIDYIWFSVMVSCLLLRELSLMWGEDYPLSVSMRTNIDCI